MDLGNLQVRLARYLEAERKVLLNQSYTIGTRTLTRVDLPFIRKGIKDLEAAIAGANGTGTIRARRVLFRDD